MFASESTAAVVRANTIPVVVEKYKGEEFRHWETVRAYKASNTKLVSADMLGLAASVKAILPRSDSGNGS